MNLSDSACRVQVETATFAMMIAVSISAFSAAALGRRHEHGADSCGELRGRAQLPEIATTTTGTSAFVPGGTSLAILIPPFAKLTAEFSF